MRFHVPGNPFAAPEITQLDLFCLRIDEDVGRFEIAMDDVVSMEVVQFYSERIEVFVP